MTTVLKILGIIVKALALLTGLAAYSSMIPASWLPIAVIVFGIASVVKDAGIHIGDWLDDGKDNDSFKP